VSLLKQCHYTGHLTNSQYYPISRVAYSADKVITYKHVYLE